jgi:hypothetical protein
MLIMTRRLALIIIALLAIGGISLMLWAAQVRLFSGEPANADAAVQTLMQREQAAQQQEIKYRKAFANHDWATACAEANVIKVEYLRANDDSQYQDWVVTADRACFLAAQWR